MDCIYFDLSETQEAMMFRHSDNAEQYDAILAAAKRFPVIELDEVYAPIADNYVKQFADAIPDTVPIEWQKKF